MTTSTTSTTERQAFLTPQEVSDLLRVSVQSVRRWINEGILPAYKVGRGWRIRQWDLDRWLSQQRSDADNNKDGNDVTASLSPPTLRT